ncbi:sciellin isoform X7 [Hemitrygon akajei]|uniref:sciellin isoform X7 n=1 Tax=Hemitrygon akajei TaxID=2704970 RepID=UPI003BF9DDF3
MSFFNKLSKAFTDDKSSTSDERDQAIRETKKKTRLLNDGEWIKNTQSDNSQNASADVNYGKSALSRVKSEESLNRDSTGPSKVTTTKSDTIDGRKRDSDTTNLNSPTKKYPSLDRYSRNNSYKTEETTTTTYQFKTDELPKMTIVTSETKTESPTNKSAQSRSSPDGQVKTPENTSSKTNLKWDSKKDETPGSTSKTSTLEQDTSKKNNSKTEPLIDLTPSTEKPKTRSSDYTSKYGSKSLIDLSDPPEKTNDRMPSTPPPTPEKISSLIDLTPPTIPEKPKRSSGDWDTITSSTTTSSKATFDPSSKSRSSGDRDTTYSSTTTSTKSTFSPTSRSPSNNDWEPISPSTTTSTKATYDRDTKPTRSTNEQDLHNDESGYKSPTSYTKTSRNFSSKSDGGRSPSSDEYQYNSRSSYKENSLPSDDDESSGYRSPGYSLQRNWSSSSSLSDGKNPAKVITMTTNYTSAGQTTKDKNVCSQCYKPFNNSPKMILDDLNINCHASCFKCQICNRSLENLNAGDSLWVHHRTVHCESCYDRAKAQLGY